MSLLSLEDLKMTEQFLLMSFSVEIYNPQAELALD